MGKSFRYGGISPQNEAILRWQNGLFSEADIRFAHQWRRDIEFFNLESMKNSVPKMDIKLRTEESGHSWLRCRESDDAEAVDPNASS